MANAGRGSTETLLNRSQADALTSPVIAWFEQQARELPWRSPTVSPWAVFVSEVMSQQTPVARIIPAWHNWMQRWPTPTDLAAAAPAEVIRAWDRLGYPRRALRLRDAAIMIRDDFGGEVPNKYDDLLLLPGVGDYTAAAVLAFAFEERVVVLDTNVRRVLARAIGGTEHPSSASPTKAERAVADQLLPLDASEAATWSVAVMELGALVCRATAPVCEDCPIATACAWNAAGRPPSEVRAKRVQKFEGTDRQVRGKLLAVLREGHTSVSAAALRSCWPDDVQRDLCLDSLVADGLVEPLARNRFRLPR